MDGRDFDNLLRSLTKSRRTVLGGALAALGAALGAVETSAKGKKKNKNKKNKRKNDDDGDSPPPPPPPPESPPPMPPRPCPDGFAVCPGQPPACCPASQPVCGPSIPGPNGSRHQCCPIGLSQVCIPPQLQGQYIGTCCRPQDKCCPPGFNSSVICCEEGKICCPGRADRGVPGCCDEQRSCCLDDQDCAENETCNDVGCCEPATIVCEPPHVTCGTQCCGEGMTCHPVHGGCDIEG